MQVAMILALSVYIAWSIGYLSVCYLAKRTWIALTLAVLGIPAIYCAHMFTLSLYFEFAIWFAKSESEIDGIVGGDGAKLISHGLAVAPFCSFIFVWTGMMLHGLGRAKRAELTEKNLCPNCGFRKSLSIENCRRCLNFVETSVYSAGLTSKDEGNPYRPPNT